MNRKELRRAYKETARPMGVYRVRNTHSGKSLIGRSVDLPSILNRERAQLRLGVHPSAELQRDWNLLGADAFAFEVLDTLVAPESSGALPDSPHCDALAELRVLEAMWLERVSDPAGVYAHSSRTAGV